MLPLSFNLSCTGVPFGKIELFFFSKTKCWALQFSLWMVYTLVVRARGLEYGGREFESRRLHCKPETKLREERGLSGCRKGLKTSTAGTGIALNPHKHTNKQLLYLVYCLIQQKCTKSIWNHFVTKY